MVSSDFAPWLDERDACGVGFIYRPQGGHDVIRDGLHALACVEHRGACGSDRETGDGAGLLTAIPKKLLAAEGWELDGRTAVGVVYLPKSKEAECRQDTEAYLKAENLTVVGWRRVPVRTEVLGSLALFTCPRIEHVIVRGDESWSEEEFEQKLMVARKRLINITRKERECEDFYVASLSCRTIVYKALVKSHLLGEFYRDLTNPRFESNWVVFHRRFSTNTFPRWALAQPFRMLAHNGEINTLLGNRNWMKAREPLLDHPAWDRCKQERQSVIYAGGSDSGSLDNALELLTRLGHTPEGALMQLIPEAYRNQPELHEHPEIVDFYEYYAALQEPWDGPAFIVYSDGRSLGALLDRNGLRPARYTLTKDGTIIVASESGLVDVAPDAVLENGRLGPGQMVSVDLSTGKLTTNWEIKSRVARQRPYGKWLNEHRVTIEERGYKTHPEMQEFDLIQAQVALGYGKEDVDTVIGTMAQGGAEPIYSMGDDTPLSILSSQPTVLYDYFKQRFAQVTNPPIDHLREQLVMSLDVFLGRRASFLFPEAESARVIQLRSPVINEQQLNDIRALGDPFAHQDISLLFDAGNVDLEKALDRLCQQALNAVHNGKVILILTDRGLNASQAAVPALLAVGALHHKLMDEGVRLNCSIIVETGQCWDVHHFACLLGYGAQAVCAYLALETIRHKFGTQQAARPGDVGAAPAPPVQQAQSNYIHAVEKGLCKVLSKMGISVLTSYIGAQIFECLGLGPGVIKRCFTGTTSRLGGLELEDIAREALQFHATAFPEARQLINYGKMSFRPSGEYHANNPALVRALHGAIGLNQKISSETEKQQKFVEYSSLLRDRPPAALRDLLSFRSDRDPVDIEEVESVEEIAKYFCTGGMSLGALSKEAHEVLAIAMNRLGARSNCGEGGEDPLRYYPISDITADGTSPQFPGLKKLLPGDSAASAIRQVASARFGVTPEYLVTAEQLEIKIAQGAKPGEGGQLPGHKVSEYIAKLRRSKSGVPLISPPPHHDIYSIEDLAQLIYDLKQVNPQAKISVKLVAEIGVGTVAAGVAKANADIIHISGHDGGTGASPLSSIKHAGISWELGLAEAHQVLLANGLRDRVALRADGGMRSGWDVIMAALLGANEFGFGTIALMAEGCVMARICHTNNCPVGITSQKEALRERFHGEPDSVIDFFLYIAQEVRQMLALLGYRSLTDIVGRVDLLEAREDARLSKVERLNLDCLLKLPVPDDRRWLPAPAKPHDIEYSFDDTLLADDDLKYAVITHGKAQKTYQLRNTDRSVGARLAGYVARHHGDEGFNGSLELEFTGTAGQSFGAFNVQNVSLSLTGQAQDYVGKGMNGGLIVVRPAHQPTPGLQNVIVGNTCLYGATGGKLFIAGQAGERFAVRNSQAVAIVEGTGDHGCEYMTGGTVVVLGKVGRNFGAGMTGGLAFVFDEHNEVLQRLNLDEGKVAIRPNGTAADTLKSLVQEHFERTGSERAKAILADWQNNSQKFWQIVPPTEATQQVEVTVTVAVAKTASI